MSPAGQLASALLLVLSSVVLVRATTRIRGRYRPIARFAAVSYLLMAVVLLGIVLYLRWQ